MNKFGEKEEMVKLINPDVIPTDEYGLQITTGHLQIECPCGNRWGVHPDENGMVAKSKLRCFKCDSARLQKLIGK